MIKRILNKFGYELVNKKLIENEFAEIGIIESNENRERSLNIKIKEFADVLRLYQNIINNCADLTIGYTIEEFELYYTVSAIVRSPGHDFNITIKDFTFLKYGSKEYARICAQELCDKLNEEP